MAMAFNMLLGKRRGAGMTEYIILVGVIAIVAIITLKFFGPSTRNKTDPRDDAAANVVAEE